MLLYREDLERIAGLATGDGKVEYRCNGYVYPELGDLIAHERVRSLQSLVIQPVGSTTEAAAVAIHPDRVEVFALSAMGDRANAVAAFLSQRSRGVQPTWWRILFRSLAWIVSIIVGALVYRYGAASTEAVPLAAGFVSVALAATLTDLQRSLGETEVHLGSRNRALKAGQIAALILVAIISGILGLIMGLAIG